MGMLQGGSELYCGKLWETFYFITSTSPQLPLWDETPRNDEELPLGDETSGTKEELHPLESAATLTPPQLPLGDETPRNKEELLLGDETLRTKGELTLGDKTLETTTIDNAQPSRVRSKNETTKMTPNHQG